MNQLRWNVIMTLDVPKAVWVNTINCLFEVHRVYIQFDVKECKDLVSTASMLLEPCLLLPQYCINSICLSVILSNDLIHDLTWH